MFAIFPFAILGVLANARGADILILHPFNLRSYSSFFRPLAHGLARRNHSVTVVSGEPNAFDESLVRVIPTWDVEGQTVLKWENSKTHFMSDIFRGHDFAATNLRVFLKSKPVQGLLASSVNESYDAVIASSFLFFHALAALPHRFNALAIEFMPQADNPLCSLWSGNILEGSKNGFLDRFEHFWSSVCIFLFNRYVFVPKHQSIIDEAGLYDNYESRPSLHQLLSNKSLILSHGHASLSSGGSVSLFQKHVAGLSLNAQDPVPKKFKEFIDESTGGFILVSWGTLTSSSEGPLGDIFLEAMSRLEQRVIWKTSRSNFSRGIPENVMTTNWVPQEALLKEKTIKVFLTHGGFSSMVETVDSGVPVVVTPSSVDQPKNAAHMVNSGMGLLLTYDNITVDSLVWSIREVVSNPKYKQAAELLSNKFKNRLVSPLDEAIFWIETAIKFKTIVPTELNYALEIFLLMNLDVLLVTLGGLSSLVILLGYLLRRKHLCEESTSHGKPKNE